MVETMYKKRGLCSGKMTALCGQEGLKEKKIQEKGLRGVEKEGYTLPRGTFLALGKQMQRPWVAV